SAPSGPWPATRTGASEGPSTGRGLRRRRLPPRTPFLLYCARPAPRQETAAPPRKAPVAPRVCVVGSSNMDLVVRTPRLPRPGETVTARSFATVCGGKGGNQAVMAARLGARVALVGKVGRDVFGERLAENYREQGVDTAHL